MRTLYAAIAALIALGSGCSPVGKQFLFETEGSGGASATSSGAGGAGMGGMGSTGTDISVGVGVGGGTGSDTGAGGASSLIAEVYGHSPYTLYRLDPITKQVTTVGDFSGCSNVIDIAIDKDSNIYGTTFGALYKIDKNTAKCTQISLGSYPNSLSFVPAGTLDPAIEALVGYNGSDYIRIDTANGDVKSIGSIGSGYASSGDIVSVIGGKTLLTVTGAGCGDCIIEVNPVTGGLVKNYGQLGYGAVFGLAFWAGSAYGFTDGGQLFEIQFSGNTVNTTLIPIPGNPGLQFWGAGSTTKAPPDPVPQ